MIPRRFVSVWIRLRSLAGRRQAARDLEREMEFHLTHLIQEYEESGTPAKEARLAALRTFGNPTLFRERTQETWGCSWFDQLQQDVRHSVRKLYKSPGFAATVILTLSLSIGANLAVFQLMRGVLFAQLPIQQPSQLYSLHAVESPFDHQWFFSSPAFERLKNATANTAPVIARSGFGGGIFQTQNGFSRRVSFQLISDNFFGVLGLQPSAGRLISAEDSTSAQTQVPVVLRYGFAKDHFGSAQAAIGLKAVFNQIPVTVIGVAPKQFFGIVQGVAPDLWLPLSAQSLGGFRTWFDSLGPGHDYNLQAPYENQDEIFWLWVLASVPASAKGSATAHWTQALQPDLHLMASATSNSLDRDRILHTNVQLISAARGEDSLGTTYARPLILLVCLAAVVFLLGCLNLANLQLARLTGRRREIGVRFALGATRWRVLRQLIAEDLLLTLLGGLLASGTSVLLSALLLHWASGREAPIPIDLHFGVAVILMGCALMLIALVSFSALPAWHVTSRNIRASTQSHTGNIVSGRRQEKQWSSWLLSVQVSLSILLLSMAALFAKTLANLNNQDAGFDRSQILSVHLDLNAGGLATHNFSELNRNILRKLKSLPFVEDAALQMCRIPNCVWNTAIHVAGHPETPEIRLHGEENHVSVEYFRTLGIPLLQGRAFSETDRKGSQPVAILNEAFSRQLFGHENPVGHYIGYQSPPGDRAYLIVGEVGNARVDGLKAEAPAIAYFSIEQNENPAGTIEVRSFAAPTAIAADIRQALRAVVPSLPISEIVPLNTEMEDGLSSEKLVARLSAIFGALTLLLAAVGFYGLMSFYVSRRTFEIGIRMAMGATREQIQTLFLRQTMTILAIGVVPGLILAEIANHLARTLLYGVGMGGAAEMLFSLAVLVLSGLSAALIPARRAALLDPARALRTE